MRIRRGFGEDDEDKVRVTYLGGAAEGRVPVVEALQAAARAVPDVHVVRPVMSSKANSQHRPTSHKQNEVAL